MRKPKYCKEKTWLKAPVGYTRCLMCRENEQPEACKKLNEKKDESQREDEERTGSRNS